MFLPWQLWTDLSVWIAVGIDASSRWSERESLPVVPETIGTHTQLKYYIHIQTHTIPRHFFPRRHTSITLNEALVFILHQSIVFPPVAMLRQAHYSNMDFQLIPRQKHN